MNSNAKVLCALQQAFGDIQITEEPVAFPIEFNGKTVDFYFAELSQDQLAAALKKDGDKNVNPQFLAAVMRGNAEGEGRISEDDAIRIKPLLFVKLLKAAFDVNGVTVDIAEAAKK